MSKKIDRAKLLEQIRAEFPGGVPEGKGRFKYVFSEEQSQWLHDNVGKEYTLNTVAVALGISYYPLMRELAKRDETMRKRFLKEQERLKDMDRIRTRSRQMGISVSEYHKIYMKNQSDQEKRVATAKKKKEAKSAPESSTNFYDQMMKEAEKERKKREREEARKQKKLEAEDAAYAAECLKRFPEDRKRKPIPFTYDQINVRSDMKKRGYILPDEDELLTDNRTNVYWNENTRRSPKMEERAISAKLSVIKYSDMFPDMSNKLSSCKGLESNQKSFYQMN